MNFNLRDFIIIISVVWKKLWLRYVFLIPGQIRQASKHLTRNPLVSVARRRPPVSQALQRRGPHTDVADGDVARQAEITPPCLLFTAARVTTSTLPLPLHHTPLPCAINTLQPTRNTHCIRINNWPTKPSAFHVICFGVKMWDFKVLALFYIIIDC